MTYSTYAHYLRFGPQPDLNDVLYDEGVMSLASSVISLLNNTMQCDDMLRLFVSSCYQ